MTDSSSNITLVKLSSLYEMKLPKGTSEKLYKIKPVDPDSLYSKMNKLAGVECVDYHPDFDDTLCYSVDNVFDTPATHQDILNLVLSYL